MFPNEIVWRAPHTSTRGFPLMAHWNLTVRISFIGVGRTPSVTIHVANFYPFTTLIHHFQESRNFLIV